VGELLVEAVKQAYPNENIIDEEAGVVDNRSDFTWVIDPIDGTSNFAAGLPMFGIMIGLLHKGVPVLGGIALPFYQEFYIGGKDLPTTKNGKPVRLSNKTKLSDCLVVYGMDGYQDEPERTYQETQLVAKIVLACRNLRASNSVFDTAKTAEGAFGVSINQGSKIWDNVAQQAVVEGTKDTNGKDGVYTDVFGQPIDYSNPLTRVDQNFTFCAGPAALHAQAQAVIHGRVAA